MQKSRRTWSVVKSPRILRSAESLWYRYCIETVFFGILWNSSWDPRRSGRTAGSAFHHIFPISGHGCRVTPSQKQSCTPSLRHNQTGCTDSAPPQEEIVHRLLAVLSTAIHGFPGLVNTQLRTYNIQGDRMRIIRSSGVVGAASSKVVQTLPFDRGRLPSPEEVT